MAATPAPIPALGYRWTCPHRASVLCESGSGRPPRAKCRRCGGAYVVSRGWFGVFEWRQDGRYPMEAAKSVHTTEAAAGKASGTEYVVRWIPAP